MSGRLAYIVSTLATAASFIALLSFFTLIPHTGVTAVLAGGSLAAFMCSFRWWLECSR